MEALDAQLHNCIGYFLSPFLSDSLSSHSQLIDHDDLNNIFSLKSDSWREIDGFMCGVIHYGLSKMVNGKLHWVTSDGDILSIDLADEKCEKLALLSLKLGVFGSDLFMFRKYQRTNIDVWLMKEYGIKESWTKMYTIKLPDESSNYVQISLFYESNKGEMLLAFVCGKIHDIQPKGWLLSDIKRSLSIIPYFLRKSTSKA
ncbi:F-box protein CPR1-like [Nicotiana tomentosiformis]|uniref:F-box protein CPR1-like n=1 Tax=Nicotiana tomentosiformis TaxID=4098 RepID=UPI00388C67B4